jgi:uncharacterized Fe-S radical SAM superfamily protein PflX
MEQREPSCLALERSGALGLNLMGQCYPAGRSDKHEEIDRRPHREELEQAFEIADQLGLVRLDPRSRRQALPAA